MRTLLCLALLVATTSCESLWSHRQVTDPRYCVAYPEVCTSYEQCSPETERCEPRTPSIVRVTPAQVSSSTATQITIDGLYFHPDSIVLIDGQPAIDVSVDSISRITATVPPRTTPLSWGRAAARLEVRYGDQHSERSDLLAYAASAVGFKPWIAMNLAPNNLSPAGLTVSDVNGDGTPDVLSKPDEIYVSLGKGDATFQPVSKATTGVTQQGGFVVDDFDGDAKVDLAVAQRGTPSILLFAGNGDGTFGSARSIPSGRPLLFARSADMNGDGKPDLVAADSDGGYVVSLLSLGGGMFGPPLTTPTYGEPRTPLIADFDGDKRHDLVLGSSLPRELRFHGGRGDGTFSTFQTFGYPVSVGYSVVRDIDRDGQPDLVVSDSTSATIYVYLGFGRAPRFELRRTTGGGTLRLLAVDDWNGDQAPDILLAETELAAPTVYVQLGYGDGTFQPGGMRIAPPFPQITDAVSADFNRDGRPDVMFISGSSPHGYLLINTPP